MMDAAETLTVVSAAAIDVKPGSSSHAAPINLKSKLVPVAILGSSSFDVADVVVSSLEFGPDGAGELHRTGHYEDVNGDGITDLVAHFGTAASGFSVGDTHACLTAETVDGLRIGDCDSVRISAP
jgi:hypothetical protein